MEEAKFVFLTDTKEKKNIARSASNRVGKTKKCTLPYELMSRQEREEYMKASEVEIFTLRPMSIKEFKEVPGDKQLELLKWYGEKFGWNAAGVAFGLDASYATGVKMLDKFMLGDMFKRRMRECTDEQKREFIDNRRKYKKEVEEQAANAAAQEVSEPDIHQPLENKETPVQSETEARNGSSEFAVSLNSKSKNGDAIRRRLIGIAESLDPDEQYDVMLLVRLV